MKKLTRVTTVTPGKKPALKSKVSKILLQLTDDKAKLRRPKLTRAAMQNALLLCGMLFPVLAGNMVEKPKTKGVRKTPSKTKGVK